MTQKPIEKESFVRRYRRRGTTFLIFMLIFLSMAIPINMSDGTEKFTGIEKEAAQSALEHMIESYNGIDRLQVIGVFKFYASDVKPYASESGRENCQGSVTRTNKDNPDFYEVAVHYKTYFGITNTTSTPIICVEKDIY